MTENNKISGKKNKYASRPPRVAKACWKNGLAME
jgi:hypothetical protein